MALRVLCAPNAFKGSLTAAGAAAAMVRGVRRAGGWGIAFPVADGGDGTADVLGGRRVAVRIVGPFGERLRAWYRRRGAVAFIDVAQAGMARASRRDPLHARSDGIGTLILHAIARGATRVVVALGGSATVDGGTGVLRAMGGWWTDVRGRRWTGGGPPADPADFRCEHAPGIRFTALCDVRTRLFDCARVFGPQKGATAKDVRELGRRLRAMARRIGARAARLPGSGAAGGIGWGLAAAFGAELVPGAAYILQDLGFDAAARRCDLVLTGEGQWDATTAAGKAPWAVRRAAARLGVPSLALCGVVRGRPRGVRAIADSAEAGMRHAARLLEQAAYEAVRAHRP